MKSPSFYTSEQCAHCGAPKRRVNPEWLRALRKQEGWSLRLVASRAGVCVGFVSDVERGRRNWSPRLAKGYGLGPEFFR